jgi:hypothetical protein
MLKSISLPILAGAAAAGLFVAGPLMVGPAQADLFNFTSCELSGGCGTATQFGTVDLTQSGTSVHFDVVLNPGNLFVETGAGAGEMFLFNDALANSTITGISATLNGSTVTIPRGLTGLTNISPPVMADGTGHWSASVECTTVSSCNGASGPDVNDLHFDVTNATLAQLETTNDAGNFFVADILCGQTGCTGLTGDVNVNTPAVPAPLIGHGLLVMLAVGGVLFGGKLVENLKKRQSLAA